jgi:hypothetical protein
VGGRGPGARGCALGPSITAACRPPSSWRPRSGRPFPAGDPTPCRYGPRAVCRWRKRPGGLVRASPERAQPDRPGGRGSLLRLSFRSRECCSAKVHIHFRVSVWDAAATKFAAHVGPSVGVIDYVHDRKAALFRQRLHCRARHQSEMPRGVQLNPVCARTPPKPRSLELACGSGTGPCRATSDELTATRPAAIGHTRKT